MFLMGSGDAGAHVGAISDGSWPTYLLSHWARDRDRGPVGHIVTVNQESLELLKHTRPF
jgi:N-acyl-D-aspartate/D-glutamate deacylase